jgi:hypothetical protein
MDNSKDKALPMARLIWLLVVGYWLLVVGYWLLVVDD